MKGKFLGLFRSKKDSNDLKKINRRILDSMDKYDRLRNELDELKKIWKEASEKLGKPGEMPDENLMEDNLKRKEFRKVEQYISKTKEEIARMEGVSKIRDNINKKLKELLNRWASLREAGIVTDDHKKVEQIKKGIQELDLDTANELIGLFEMDVIRSERIRDAKHDFEIKQKVFISYSTKDIKISKKVCDFLEENSILCWMAPRDISPGANYAGSIVKAIDDCRIMVVIFSSNSNSSQQVLREVDQAVSSNKVLVPVRIENIQPNSDIGYYLRVTHWLDVYVEGLDKHLTDLEATVRSKLLEGENKMDQMK